MMLVYLVIAKVTIFWIITIASRLLVAPNVNTIIIHAILKVTGPFNGSSCWIPRRFVIYDCLFQRRDDAHGSWRLAQGVITS